MKHRSYVITVDLFLRWTGVVTGALSMLVVVRFLAGRKARREQIEELPVSFADRRGDRVDKAARGGRRIKERRESRGSIGGRTEPS
jgi:hypothetical protein